MDEAQISMDGVENKPVARIRSPSSMETDSSSRSALSLELSSESWSTSGKGPMEHASILLVSAFHNGQRKSFHPPLFPSTPTADIHGSDVIFNFVLGCIWWVRVWLDFVCIVVMCTPITAGSTGAVVRLLGVRNSLTSPVNSEKLYS